MNARGRQILFADPDGATPMREIELSGGPGAYFSWAAAELDIYYAD